MNLLKLFTNMMLLVMIILNCTTQQKTSSIKRPHWGDSPDTVIYLEQNRLSQKPLKQYVSDNDNYKMIIYDDRFLDAMCRLSYHFIDNKLLFIMYSSSNPRWDQEELNYQLRKKLDDLYGSSSEIKIGQKTYQHWIASDAYIYFYFERILQDKIFWRTFIANVIYSSQSVDESSFLKNFLLKSRY